MAKFTDELVTRLSVVGAEAMAGEFRKAGGSAKGFGKDLDGGLSKQVSIMNLAAGAGALGGQLSGMGDQALGASREMVMIAARFDSLDRGLTAVMGSSGAAKDEFFKLREVAKLPGLGLEEAVAGSTRLQATGMSADLSRNALLGFGNALASVGGGKAELDRVTRALSQIQAKGKVSAEEINQLAEALPQIRAMMQNAFGTANTEQLQKMGLSSKEFITSITAEFMKLPRVTGGIQNSFENLDDATKLLKLSLGNELVPTISAVSDSLATMTEDFANADPWMKKTVAWGVAGGGAILKVSGGALQTAASVGQLATGLQAMGASAATIRALAAGTGLWGVTLLAAAGTTGLILRDVKAFGEWQDARKQAKKSKAGADAMQARMEAMGYKFNRAGGVVSKPNATATRGANGEDINVRIRGGAGVSGRTIGDVIALVNG